MRLLIKSIVDNVFKKILYTGARGMSICESCIAGRFAIVGQSVCSNCTAGKYAIGAKSEICELCQVWKY